MIIYECGRIVVAVISREIYVNFLVNNGVLGIHEKFLCEISCSDFLKNSCGEQLNIGDIWKVKKVSIDTMYEKDNKPLLKKWKMGRFLKKNLREKKNCNVL